MRRTDRHSGSVTGSSWSHYGTIWPRRPPQRRQIFLYNALTGDALSALSIATKDPNIGVAGAGPRLDALR